MGSAMLQDGSLATERDLVLGNVDHQGVCTDEAVSEQGLPYGFNEKDRLKSQLGEIL